jgi:hypothetical protein
MLWNQEQMYDRIMELLENAEMEVLGFFNAHVFTISTDEETLQRPKREARKRGVKFRYITEITKDNLSYCKRQLDTVDELRHLDKVMGNFLMSEHEFIASHDISPQHPITDGFYSNVKKIVKLQGYIFETLWEHAISAAERINQLEAANASSGKTGYTVEKEPRKRVLDRFYVCKQCNTIFVYAEDLKEHQTTTGHREAKEFPFFDW